jgi:hypothetical protein
MMVLKHNNLTYVNKVDKGVYRVSLSLYMDENHNVRWMADEKTGHYYPVAYDLSGLDYQKHIQEISEEGRQATLAGRRETHDRNQRIAETQGEPDRHAQNELNAS